MKKRERRSYGKSPSGSSKKKFHTNLKPTLPTYDEWKKLVNDFENMKMHNQGKIDRFHHQNKTITSINRIKQINENKNFKNKPRRLSKSFFYPRSPSKLQPLLSPSKSINSILSPQKLQRLEKQKINKAVGHIIKLFQRKSGMKLFYLFDKDKKGYFNSNDINIVLNDIGYNSLNKRNKENIYNKLSSLCDDDNITFSNLRQIDIEDLNTNYLGDKIYRTNREQLLYQKYLNPVNRKNNNNYSTNDGKLFFCESDKEKATEIVSKLQNRYSNLEKPLSKLKCWDINKDGRIERDEMQKMLNKMNIYLNNNELNEFFKLFHKNEIKRKGNKSNIDEETISYPIFLQTIMKHDFDSENDKNQRNTLLLTPPQKKKKPQQIGNIDEYSLKILQRLRNRAETKFGSKNLSTNVFRYLDTNFDAFINHNEFKSKLKYIDTQITPKQSEKIIKLMDPSNDGQIRYNQFAQCFNFPIKKESKYIYNDNPHKRLNTKIFDIDPNSTYYISTKERFNKNKYIPHSNNSNNISPTKQSKKNISNTNYNILHHK